MILALFASEANDLIAQAPAIVGYGAMCAMGITFIKWLEKRHDAEKEECARERREHAEYMGKEHDRIVKAAAKAVAVFAKHHNLLPPGEKR